jgi:hypothetical protein
MTKHKPKPAESRPARHTDDAERSAREASQLLGLGDDPSRLCPADRLRCDLVATLRIAIDHAGATAMEGGSADVGRLVSAVEQLTRLLPPKTVEPVSHREDPREALLKIIMTMRERDADGFEGYDGKVKQVEVLQAEIAQLRAQLAGKTPEDSDVPTVVERVPAAAGNVVPLSRPNPPAAPAAYDYDRERGWRDHVLPDGSISREPFGGGRKYWGPV